MFLIFEYIASRSQKKAQKCVNDYDVFFPDDVWPLIFRLTTVLFVWMIKLGRFCMQIIHPNDNPQPERHQGSFCSKGSGWKSSSNSVLCPCRDSCAGAVEPAQPMASSTSGIGEAFRKPFHDTHDTRMFCHLWGNVPEDSWGAGFEHVFEHMLLIFSWWLLRGLKVFAEYVGQSSIDVAPWTAAVGFVECWHESTRIWACQFPCPLIYHHQKNHYYNYEYRT